MSGGERRRHPRFPVEKASALFFTADRAVFARLADISEGGLGAHVPTPFRAGDLVGVKVEGKPPRGAGGGTPPIQMRARVAWAADGQPPGIGLELIEILAGEEEFRRLLDAAAVKRGLP